MNGERAKLVIKLILGIAAIAVCCLFIIFVMRACSAEKGNPDSSNTPVISDEGQDNSPSGSGTDTGEQDNTLSNYADYEDNSAYESLGNYMNDRILTYDYGSGTISLGVDLGIQDYLYLNPVCFGRGWKAGRLFHYSQQPQAGHQLYRRSGGNRYAERPGG